MLTPQDRLRLYKQAKADLARYEEEERQAQEIRNKRLSDMGTAMALIKYLEPMIEQPEGGEPFARTTVEEDFVHGAALSYPSGSTWQEKIKSVLKHNNRVMKIVDMLPVFIDNEDMTKYTEASLKAVVSNISNAMVTKGLLKVYNNKTKGFYYGNPIWWEGEKLKDEHLPNTENKTLW